MNAVTRAKQEIQKFQEQCKDCGYSLVLEPDNAHKERYLRTPSIGALFWTQGWTLGARLYLWLVISFIPVVGIIALIATVLFGRRWSWKYGGWQNWEMFTQRMKLLDTLAVIWIVGLVGAYFFARSSSGLS